MFKDREEAGRKLALALYQYKDKKDTVIFAIPRGGIAVAAPVSQVLHLPLEVLIVRKLSLPDNPEAGIGALSETGEVVWQPFKEIYPSAVRERIKKEQEEEIKKRIDILRGGKNLPSCRGKIVILIDDGLAMGSTMAAAVKTVQSLKAKKVIVAVPVGSREAKMALEKMGAEVICLEMPTPFYAVAQGYESFPQINIEKAKTILKNFKRKV